MSLSVWLPSTSLLARVLGGVVLMAVVGCGAAAQGDAANSGCRWSASELEPSPREEGDRGMLITTSAHDFPTTVERVRAAIESRGATVLGEVDHGAGAARVGLELRPTMLFIFGNPKIGTHVMVAHPSMGLELPLKLLVWQDEGGAVQVGYNDPAEMFERHGVRDQDEILGKMRGVLESVSAEAAGK